MKRTYPEVRLHEEEEILRHYSGVKFIEDTSERYKMLDKIYETAYSMSINGYTHKAISELAGCALLSVDDWVKKGMLNEIANKEGYRSWRIVFFPNGTRRSDVDRREKNRRIL